MGNVTAEQADKLDKLAAGYTAARSRGKSSGRSWLSDNCYRIAALIRDGIPAADVIQKFRCRKEQLESACQKAGYPIYFQELPDRKEEDKPMDVPTAIQELKDSYAAVKGRRDAYPGWRKENGQKVTEILQGGEVTFFALAGRIGCSHDLLYAALNEAGHTDLIPESAKRAHGRKGKKPQADKKVRTGVKKAPPAPQAESDEEKELIRTLRESHQGVAGYADNRKWSAANTLLIRRLREISGKTSKKLADSVGCLPSIFYYAEKLGKDTSSGQDHPPALPPKETPRPQETGPKPSQAIPLEGTLEWFMWMDEHKRSGEAWVKGMEYVFARMRELDGQIALGLEVAEKKEAELRDRDDSIAILQGQVDGLREKLSTATKELESAKKASEDAELEKTHMAHERDTYKKKVEELSPEVAGDIKILLENLRRGIAEYGEGSLNGKHDK